MCYPSQFSPDVLLPRFSPSRLQFLIHCIAMALLPSVSSTVPHLLLNQSSCYYPNSSSGNTFICCSCSHAVLQYPSSYSCCVLLPLLPPVMTLLSPLLAAITKHVDSVVTSCYVCYLICSQHLPNSVMHLNHLQPITICIPSTLIVV